MDAPFSITIITMARSPTSLPKAGSRTKGDGQLVLDGLITIRTGGSTWWSPTTLSGAQPTTFGAENALLAIVPTAIQATTKARKRSSTIATTMAPLLT